MTQWYGVVGSRQKRDDATDESTPELGVCEAVRVRSLGRQAKLSGRTRAVGGKRLPGLFVLGRLTEVEGNSTGRSISIAARQCRKCREMMLIFKDAS